MKEAIFLKDVISLMPTNTQVRIYSSDENLMKYLDNVNYEKGDQAIEISLSSENISACLMSIDKNNLQDYIERIEMSINGKLMFEGYDHMGFGTISNSIVLPNQFVEDYIKDDMCIISKDW